MELVYLYEGAKFSISNILKENSSGGNNPTSPLDMVRQYLQYSNSIRIEFSFIWFASYCTKVEIYLIEYEFLHYGRKKKSELNS